MNQILVSEKLYVTPDMKKKKVAFRLQFILSVFLLCILSSCYIYAEYDRQKSEQVSKEILTGIDFVEPEIVEETIVVVLNSALAQEEDVDELVEEVYAETDNIQKTRTKSGTEYYTIGVINIPKINVNYPILSETSDELLKISPCKFHGADPNEVGNFCIVGHNYRNSLFFSKVPTLNSGDIIQVTDLSGRTIQYKIYNKYEVDPADVSCTTQLTNGRKEVTLITCTDDSKHRVVVKAREV